jgi:competence CoiA-like predicted nuclease
MPCCHVAAVPKTSTLGNYFFAHARRGECTTAPESAEHLYCKTLMAKAAASAGWTVTAERAGVSPGGEAWVADVFCEKGSAQVALEVQMSPQPREEAVWNFTSPDGDSSWRFLPVCA